MWQSTAPNDDFWIETAAVNGAGTVNRDTWKLNYASKLNFISSPYRCDLKHHSLWSTNVEIRDKTYFVESSATFEASGGGSTGTQKQNLQVLSLAHNAFSVVPRSLSCLAPQLTRLNLSYNKLTKMGHLSSFPASLKQLDLSHNQVDSWFMEVASDNICYSEQLIS